MNPIARRLGPLAALAFLAALPLRGADQRALLDLIVNQEPQGTVLAVIREGDALLEPAALERAGLARLGGRRESLDGIELVSLASLAPAVAWELDERELALRVTADPALFRQSVVDLRVGPPAGIVYSRDRSAFLNYSLSWGNLETLDLFGEAGFSQGDRSLLATFAQRERGGFVRGLTQLAQDDREHLRRWVLGDQFATSRNPLGGGLFLAGLGVFRDFGLDPYLVRNPLPDLAGALTTPATVEVYVNGLLVRRERLPAGEFELRNLPVAGGRGEARVVLRDAFGRQREISAPYTFTTGLLAVGLSEYGYHLGLRREDLATESFEYGDAALLARHRRGITDRVTLGGFLEAAPDLASGGPSATLRLGPGELDVAAALSEEGGESGSAAHAAYSYIGRRIGLGLSARWMSDRFANLGLPGAIDRPSLDARAFAGFSVGQRLGVSLDAGRRDFRDRGREEDGRLTATWRLTDRATLLLLGGRLRRPTEAGRAAAQATEDRVSVGISYFLGRNTTAKAYVAEEGEERQGIEVQKSLPLGTGYAYRLTVDRIGERTDAEGEVELQNRHGRLDVSHLEVAGQSVTNANLAGSLVALGGEVHLMRPVQESFAVIRVPGVAGVRGYLSNQEVGRTDAEGDLLVPNLLPYFGNRLSIADEDVPIGYVVEERERVVAPPARGGAVVGFPVWRLRAIKGSLEVVAGGETRVPDGGRLTVTAGGRTFESPVGRAGEIYLENVPPGEHPAVLETGAGTCRFEIRVPDSDEPLVDLGRLVCRL